MKAETKTKISKGELINIADALTYLATKETPAWYEIGKNLRSLKAFMNEVEGTREDIRNNCGKKDVNGNLEVVESNGVELIVWKDKNSESKQKEIWENFINEDAPEIEFCKFSIEKLSDCKLNGGLLSNLLEIIITD
jgi:hypothetical protein